MIMAGKKRVPATVQRKADAPFFGKGRDAFFGRETAKEQSPFFEFSKSNSFSSDSSSVQMKTIQENKLIQRQEQPDPEETKPVKPDETPPIPLSRKPRTANCSSDPKFPNLGCYGQQLKLDIDENLFNNAHQFIRVATLFPGDNQLMFDTFLRYGIGKNLLETSFGFAGANKKWSSILSYGTGAALKTYDLLQNGKLKLDVQLPIGNNVNFDFKLDINTNPNDKAGEEKFNTVIGVSGSF